LTRNNQAATPGRLSAIRALGDVAPAAAEEPLLAAALDPAAAGPIRAAAAAALSRFASPAIGERLAAAYPSLPPALRTAALNLLASRAAWSAALLRACQSGTIPRSDLPADLVARLRLHPGDDVSALIAKLFPSDAESTRPSAAEKIAAVRAVVEAGAGDPYRGEPIYAARCAACHRLFFKGGSIGPDLTPFQREDLGTVLPSILDPSGEIREGFENYLAQTKDGRVLGGFLADEDANAIVLRGFDGADHTIPRDQVTRLTPAGRSLMPDGLLDGLSDQELRDFFAYLRIPQPISR
ncbi:MAG: c-type cytochrome, partial [Verrucomicrobiales bacterium]